ncbi:MAG: hypothetical protein WCD18_22270 [Thermosynechococcaceae cyanobacterium]
MRQAYLHTYQFQEHHSLSQSAAMGGRRRVEGNALKNLWWRIQQQADELELPAAILLRMAL